MFRYFLAPFFFVRNYVHKKLLDIDKLELFKFQNKITIS